MRASLGTSWAMRRLPRTLFQLFLCWRDLHRRSRHVRVQSRFVISFESLKARTESEPAVQTKQTGYLKWRCIVMKFSQLQMGPLQLSDHVVLKNRRTGEQMTHWDMLNKENSNLVALLNLSQCVFCSPVCRFCITWLLRCKGPIGYLSQRWKATT